VYSFGFGTGASVMQYAPLISSWLSKSSKPFLHDWWCSNFRMSVSPSVEGTDILARAFPWMIISYLIAYAFIREYSEWSSSSEMRRWAFYSYAFFIVRKHLYLFHFEWIWGDNWSVKLPLYPSRDWQTVEILPSLQVTFNPSTDTPTPLSYKARLGFGLALFHSIPQEPQM